MRYLALDLGTKRTGIAVGDDETGSAMPVAVVDTPDEAALLAAVTTQIEEHGPDAIVVGLPLNMDGTEGPRAELSRAFADALSESTGVPVHLHDERLTSFEAEQRMLAFNCGGAAQRLTQQVLTDNLGPRLKALVEQVEALLTGQGMMPSQSHSGQGGSS